LKYGWFKKESRKNKRKKGKEHTLNFTLTRLYSYSGGRERRKKSVKRGKKKIALRGAEYYSGILRLLIICQRGGKRGEKTAQKGGMVAILREASSNTFSCIMVTHAGAGRKKGGGGKKGWEEGGEKKKTASASEH